MSRFWHFPYWTSGFDVCEFSRIPNLDFSIAKSLQYSTPKFKWASTYSCIPIPLIKSGAKATSWMRLGPECKRRLRSFISATWILRKHSFRSMNVGGSPRSNVNKEPESTHHKPWIMYKTQETRSCRTVSIVLLTCSCRKLPRFRRPKQENMELRFSDTGARTFPRWTDAHAGIRLIIFLLFIRSPGSRDKIHAACVFDKDKIRTRLS